jgi:hypothetical protein
MPHLLIVFASALLILLAGATSEAAGKRPTISQAEDCPDYDCEGGIICSCCYDDGCWICTARKDGPLPDFYNTCEWEQAARRKGVTKIRPGGGILDPGPPPPPSFNLKPYSVPGGALSK